MKAITLNQDDQGQGSLKVRTEMNVELSQRVQQLAPREGLNQTSLPGLNCHRVSEPNSFTHVVYQPCLCVVVQGNKEAVLGTHIYHYNPNQYLLLTVALPLEARVIEASSEKPFLSLALTLDFDVVHDLVNRSPTPELLPGETTPAIQVSAMNQRIEQCLLRLLDALDDALEREVLLPLIIRELHFYLLQSEQGYLLRQVAARDSNAVKAQKVVRYLEEHYANALDVGHIADATNMSVSSLHHSFKAATALTPMQYLKRIRLHRARLLLAGQGINAGDVAYRVGYNSVAQFSRDFKQQFGLTSTMHRKNQQQLVQG